MELLNPLPQEQARFTILYSFILLNLYYILFKEAVEYFNGMHVKISLLKHSQQVR